MKEKPQTPRGESGKEKQHRTPRVANEEKALSPGTMQPHAAKKVALGPNTDR